MGLLLFQMVARDALPGASWSEMFVDTPLMNIYYRLMGAKVGSNCTIGTPVCAAFDLVSIGDNASIGAETIFWATRLKTAGW